MNSGKPVFDHKAPAARVKDVNGRPVLTQDGVVFSNAEFNKFTNKFEPEPVPIAPDEPYRAFLMPKVLELIETVQKLNDTVYELVEPIKMVLNAEAITTSQVRTALAQQEEIDLKSMITENQFKFLGADKLRKWVENNKESIRCLDEDSDVLTALIDRWEKFFSEEEITDFLL